MFVSASLKKRIAIAGFSVLALTAAFNETAANTNAAGMPPAPALVKRTVAQQQQLDAQMVSLFKRAQATIEKNSVTLGYAPYNDQALIAMAVEMETLLAKGANPNHYTSGGLALAGASDLTAFQAAIALAHLLDRPALVDSFIRHGADVKKAASDGWTPMDYAVVSFLQSQATYRRHVESAAAIMVSLQKAGASLADAPMTAGMFSTPEHGVPGYKSLGLNTVGMAVLRDKGLITAEEYRAAVSGRPELAGIMKNTPGLSKEFFEALGATLNDYPDVAPGGPEPYVVTEGETLRSLATRFRSAMGAASVDAALDLLVKKNAMSLNDKMTPDTALGKGAKILIPVPRDHQIGMIKVTPGSTIATIAQNIRGVYYNPKMSPDEIAADIATMNGLNIEDLKSGKGQLTAGQTLFVTFFNDAYLFTAALTPPAEFDRSRQVYLATIEGGKQEDAYHGKQTFSVINKGAYALNPSVDLSLFYSWEERPLVYGMGNIGSNNEAFLAIVANSVDSPAQDRIILSHSMGVFLGPENIEPRRQSYEFDNVHYEGIRILLDDLQTSKPIIFTASGNWYLKEGKTQSSHGLNHSPRAVNIGAVGKYPAAPSGDDKKLISPYSSYGADACVQLPVFLSGQMEGTSFATPFGATTYRQMSQWYGDRLTFEEIMAVGLMTASRDFSAYRNPALYISQTPVLPSSLQTAPAVFRTNGGGMPVNGQCGAGVIDPHAWNEALKTMVEMKKTVKAPAQQYSLSIETGSPSGITRDAHGNATEYVYRIKIPHDMTLGKLTFLLPQSKGEMAEVVVKTPAGYEQPLPPSEFRIISTFDFAYEDVKAGSFIELRSTKPLAATAGIILRGESLGNAIQLMREHLKSKGVLHEPGKLMMGSKVVGNDTGIEPSSRGQEVRTKESFLPPQEDKRKTPPGPFMIPR